VVFVIFLLVILVVAHRVTTPEERARLLRIAQAYIQQVRAAEARGRVKCQPFFDALRARTSLVLVTPALVAMNIAAFVFMLFGSGSLSDPHTLVEWGASFGPHTSNGEWWRILTATFVHAGMIQLLANMAGLIQPALIVERLVGHVALAVVYLAAGAFANLLILSGHPVDVTAGASGAIFGVYGLLIVSLISGLVNASDVRIPLAVLKRLSPAAGVFILYNLATGDLFNGGHIVGLLTGIAGGAVLTIGAAEQKPAVQRVAAAAFGAVVIVIGAAIPLRGIADVRPELARVVAVEDRTANAYQAAVDRLRKNKTTAEALAEMIDRTIVPELHAEGERLAAIKGVPQQHQPLVKSAEEYLRLRDESWRLRAEGLRKTNMTKLRQAERTERASLEALQQIK
jgi:rhomboid protease GluP